MNLTKDEEAQVLQWLGKWEPGKQCPTGELLFPQTRNDVEIRHTHCATCGFDYTANEYEAPGSHDIPQPSLTKADAIDCLEKGGYGLVEDLRQRLKLPYISVADAIFRAALAYREAQGAREVENGQHYVCKSQPQEKSR